MVDMLLVLVVEFARTDRFAVEAMADFFRDRANMAEPQSEFPQVDNEETNLLHQAISRKTPGYVPENSISNEETRLLEQLLSGTAPDEE